MSICTLTDAAKNQINALCKQHDCYAISLNLKGGGCAGFEYQWSIVKNINELSKLDLTIDTGDHGNFAIGAHSVMFLIGTEVDYVHSLTGTNFEIRNPNAKSSCGCGVSVNFDLDQITPVME
jgi:iron-sulfur cluster assembly accessory protein